MKEKEEEEEDEDDTTNTTKKESTVAAANVSSATDEVGGRWSRLFNFNNASSSSNCTTPPTTIKEEKANTQIQSMKSSTPQSRPASISSKLKMVLNSFTPVMFQQCQDLVPALPLRLVCFTPCMLSADNS